MRIRDLFLVFITVFSLGFRADAQRLFNGVKKISNARGTYWMSWGYNRSAYSKSDIQFKDDSYDFTLSNALAEDTKYGFTDHVAAATMFKTQFDFRTGYYFRNKYAVSLGYSRFDYVLNDGNQVLLDGVIDSTNNTPWRGSSNNRQVTTNRSDFHYANNMHFLNLGIQRTDKLYQSRNKMAAFSMSYGAMIGGIISNNTFRFAGQLSEKNKSFSGYGLAAFASARLEFFRHLFIQGQLSGGSMNQLKVRTATINDRETHASQRFWFGQRTISLGFFYYFKPQNGCNDCPVW